MSRSSKDACHSCAHSCTRTPNYVEDDRRNETSSNEQFRSEKEVSSAVNARCAAPTTFADDDQEAHKRPLELGFSSDDVVSIFVVSISKQVHCSHFRWLTTMYSSSYSFAIPHPTPHSIPYSIPHSILPCSTSTSTLNFPALIIAV